MRVDGKYSGYSISKLLLGALICLALAGCSHGQKSSGPGSSKPASRAELAVKHKKLQRTLASRDEEILALKKDAAALNMKILEYEAVIHDLQLRSEGHQQRLDAAIIEVVRTKARLRSLESKAEAASTIAEAEIAVTALKEQITSTDPAMKEEISTAEQLLKMSTREFKARNFGGALYLANQSKGQVRALHMRLRGGARETRLEDEKSFAQPLPLKVLANSNLRSGPGLDYEIIGTLGEGALVTGHSYRGRWVRVKTANQAFGWLFQPLVGPR